MATIETWTFAVATPPNIDLNGFNVEARDGKIGKVDEATHEVRGRFIVVETGPWIFGKMVMLPDGMVREIDPETATIVVDITMEELKDEPEHVEDAYRDE